MGTPRKARLARTFHAKDVTPDCDPTQSIYIAARFFGMAERGTWPTSWLGPWVQPSILSRDTLSLALSSRDTDRPKHVRGIAEILEVEIGGGSGQCFLVFEPGTDCKDAHPAGAGALDIP